MGRKVSDDLVAALLTQPGVDFTLDRIYQLVVPSGQKGASTQDMHSRCSRPIGQAKVELGRRGYVLVKGELRHSYRCVRRSR